MIIETNGKRTRKVKFQTHKIIGENKYELHYTEREKLLQVNIPLNYEGKLATSIGDYKRYEISFNKLPDKVKKQVVVAIGHIENNGTPMDNDESIYS